jgi:hypothetical protein
MVSFTDEELAGLEAVAEADGLPAATYIRRLVVKHVNRIAGLGRGS